MNQGDTNPITVAYMDMYKYMAIRQVTEWSASGQVKKTKLVGYQEANRPIPKGYIASSISTSVTHPPNVDYSKKTTLPRFMG